MVTAASLLATDPDQVREVAGYYRAAAAAVAVRGDELDATSRSLRGGWSGLAQRSAEAALSGVRARLRAATGALTSADQALSEFAEAIAVTRRLVGDESLGSVGRSLRMATAADADAARRLAEAGIWFTATSDRLTLPTPGTDPASVWSWWSRLTDAQHATLITTRSADLMALDGIPADARDNAARMTLHAQSTDLRARRAGLAADGLPTADLDRSIAGLDEIERRVNDPGSATRDYVLDLDANRDRAVVSIGDPDRSSDVVTVVSGLGSGLPETSADLDAAAQIRAAGSAAAGAGQDVAAVAWLGYDAPRTLQDAMGTSDARTAAEPLARFVTGQAVTHQGSPAHESLLGYSYGSTVVGAAAGSQHLPVSDIVLVASPGATVDHAADLGIDPSRVWATTAAADPVRLAHDPRDTARDLLTGHQPDHLWFGTDPTSSSFGAQVFDSGSGSWWHPIATHTGYFDPGTESLERIGDIVAGRPPA